VCAKIAGEVAARACKKEGELSEYEQRWRNAIGKELSMGMKIHRLFGRLNNNELNEVISFFNQPEVKEIIMDMGYGSSFHSPEEASWMRGKETSYNIILSCTLNAVMNR